MSSYGVIDKVSTIFSLVVYKVYFNEVFYFNEVWSSSKFLFIIAIIRFIILLTYLHSFVMVLQLDLLIRPYGIDLQLLDQTLLN